MQNKFDSFILHFLSIKLSILLHWGNWDIDLSHLLLLGVCIRSKTGRKNEPKPQNWADKPEKVTAGEKSYQGKQGGNIIIKLSLLYNFIESSASELIFIHFKIIFFWIWGDFAHLLQHLFNPKDVTVYCGKTMPGPPEVRVSQ